MTVEEARHSYLSELSDLGYSGTEVAEKARLLRRWFQFALAVYHPAIPAMLKSVDVKSLRSLGKQGRASVRAFLDRFRSSAESVSYLSLVSFIEENETECGMRERSRRGMLEGLAGTVEVASISEQLGRQVLGYLEKQSIMSADADSRAFLIHCFEKGWLGWNPHQGQRYATDRVFEPDFLGPAGGVWREGLREYLCTLRDERNLGAGGIDHYARKLKVFVEWLEGKGCDDVQVSTLKEFIECKRQQGVGESTLSKYLYSIRYFLEHLMSVGRLKRRDNPAAALRIRAHRHAERQTLNETEVKKVIDSMEQATYRSGGGVDIATVMAHFRAVRDLAMFLLFLFCGLRLSEVAEMRVEDLDGDKRGVRIQAKGNCRVRKKVREILVDERVWKALREYVRIRPHPGQQYLWIGWSGAPLRLSSLIKIIHHRIAEAGIIKAVSPHGLRATCASLYVKNGMDPYALKTLLGHTSLKTTMDHYARLTEDQLRQVWKKSNPLAGMDDE